MGGVWSLAGQKARRNSLAVSRRSCSVVSLLATTRRSSITYVFAVYPNRCLSSGARHCVALPIDRRARRSLRRCRGRGRLGRLSRRGHRSCRRPLGLGTSGRPARDIGDRSGRGVAVRCRSLITRRSQVQILPPPLDECPGHMAWAFDVVDRASPVSSTGFL